MGSGEWLLPLALAQPGGGFLDDPPTPGNISAGVLDTVPDGGRIPLPFF